MRRMIALHWLFAAFATAVSPALASSSAEPVASASTPSLQILVMLKVAPRHFAVGSSYGSSNAEAGYGPFDHAGSSRQAAESIARKNGFTVVDGWPMPLLGVDCFVMRIASGVSVGSAVAEVARDRRVAWSEPMEIYQARSGAAEPRMDPLFPVEPAAMSWHLAQLHEYSSGRGVKVAVIDSKVDVRHPDLAGHFIADENFLASTPAEAELHGTAVAGIIGATAGNGVGIAGIAPNARLMALRACWQVNEGSLSAATYCETLGLARALQYAIDHNADVINLSLSGPPGLLLAKLISIAVSRRASVVAAFDPKLPRGGFPASQAGVIAVADESLRNLPPNVYSAPARDIPTTEPGGRWYLVNGTSFAVAHVSGLVALVREHRKSALLTRTASGQIDACASVLGSSRGCDCACRVVQARSRGRR